MCGILAYASAHKNLPRTLFLKANNQLKHRGPDASGVFSDKKDTVHLGHNRLAIVSVNTGAQPIVKQDIVLCVNGEIYNYKHLAETLRFDPTNISDCESIIHVYNRFGPTPYALQQLDGMFAFVLYDKKKSLLWSARDPFGITSLYIGKGEDLLVIASEIKAIEASMPSGELTSIEEFPPGQMLTTTTNEIQGNLSTCIYHPALLPGSEKWKACSTQMMEYTDAVSKVRRTLISAVEKREMSDVPSGVLLSGGLDSSVIAAIMSSRRRKEQDISNTTPDNEKLVLEDHRLQSFSIGLKGSPDHAAAKVVADHIGSHHHEFHFTIQEALDALPEVIRHLETYDVTTIRASTPMFLLSRIIKARGIKMVLSGEGSDEIFGGYLYFHKAPSEEAFKAECERRVKDLHYFDCLRANKSTMAWGLEVRVPFLDKQFVDTCMQIPTAYKMCGNGKLEKQLLRDAFKDDLPSAIIDRQKEQFSDGVGYQWIDQVKEYTALQITDDEFATRTQR